MDTSNPLCKDIMTIIYKYKKAFEVFERDISKEYMERAFLIDLFENDNVVIHRALPGTYHIRYYLSSTEMNVMIGIMRFEKYKLQFSLKYYFNQQRILKNKINEIKKYG